MQNRPLWHPHVRHVIESIEKIERYLARSGLDDEMAYDAILRNLATLSGSADKIPIHIKQEYPHISWKLVKGFRNHLVHAYLGDHISLDIIEDTIVNRLPVLKAAAQDILRRFPDGA